MVQFSFCYFIGYFYHIEETNYNIQLCPKYIQAKKNNDEQIPAISRHTKYIYEKHFMIYICKALNI